MDDRGRSLREALKRSRRGRTRWRCPLELRSDVVAYARGRRASGDVVASIARDVGLSETGLWRWLRSDKSGFRRVRVEEEDVSASACLTLITPGGYRLEGVSEDLALRLLREL
jgi:hypothetical protein